MSFISAIWTPVKSEQLQEDAPHYDPGNILRILCGWNYGVTGDGEDKKR